MRAATIGDEGDSDGNFFGAKISEREGINAGHERRLFE